MFQIPTVQSQLCCIRIVSWKLLGNFHSIILLMLFYFELMVILYTHVTVLAPDCTNLCLGGQEPVKAAFPDLSYADLWTLAGVTAIESMGGPDIRWRSGRTDSDKPTTVPDGRLPDADRGTPGSTIAHIRKIFSRMGFNDREMVALMGAHAVGRCHPEASGYWGPWTNAETTFSNEYFTALLRVSDVD